MSSDFATAVSWYLLEYHLTRGCGGVTGGSSAVSECNVSCGDASDSVQGKLFSADGPAPFLGDILEHPDMLWTEDKWNDEKEDAAKLRIIQQGGKTTPYWREHYESQAGRYWHQFYQRNQDHFYKDRHYLHIIFPELAVRSTNGQCVRLLEVGCGVGNAAVPLLDVNPDLHITAVDFAKSAIEILQAHLIKSNLEDRMVAKVNNIVVDESPVPNTTLDFVLCFFVLSAMSSDAHALVFRKIASMLKPGGKLLMRDYGRYDEAQLRFKKGSKLDDNFYVRQDGTCSYFFTLEELRKLAEDAGLVVEECEFILRQYANRQQRKARYRVWVHAKFMKLA